jgi:hypothetical protein
MKATKTFTISGSKLHCPENMNHLDGTAVFNVTTVDGVPMVILQLEKQLGRAPIYMRVRMTIAEARDLSKQLSGAADNAQHSKPMYEEPERKSAEENFSRDFYRP